MFDPPDKGSSLEVCEKPPTLDIDRYRRDTPACSSLLHLNHAGASLPPRPVQQAVLDYLELEATLGGYEAELARSAELDQVYTQLARLLGAHPQEIAITQNATRAWDMIFYSLPLAAGDRILTCQAEYASNMIALMQRCRATGAEVVVLANDAQGVLCLEDLQRHLDERVRLVTVNHVPSHCGLIQPVEAIGRLLRDHPAFYLIDACQSVGQLPLSVQALGCDALSATSRKFLRGPRGVGFLYVRQERIAELEPPLLDLRSATWCRLDGYALREDAKRFETYETFVAGRLGLGAAADYALEVGLEAIALRVQRLAASLRQGLTDQGAQVHERGDNLSGIVSFTLDGADPERVAAWLRAQGVNIWCNTVNSARRDMEAKGLSIVMRASPHYLTTEWEIARFLELLKRFPG